MAGGTSPGSPALVLSDESRGRRSDRSKEMGDTCSVGGCDAPCNKNTHNPEMTYSFQINRECYRDLLNTTKNERERKRGEREQLENRKTEKGKREKTQLFVKHDTKSCLRVKRRRTKLDKGEHRDMLTQ